MAQFDFSDLGGLMLDFAELAALPDSLTTEMLEAESKVIVAAQKATAHSMGVVDTGLTASSIKAGNIKNTGDGKSVYIYPQNSRTRGRITTRNAEIAFIDEFGKRGQPARPFIKEANERYADKAVNAAFKVYDDYLKSKNL